MSTWKAFGWAFVLLALAVIALAYGEFLWVVGLGSAGLVFAAIFHHKFSRDYGPVIGQFLQHVQHKPAALEPPPMPPKTSPGSKRLFVPPPLND